MVTLFKSSLQKKEMPDYEYQIYVEGKVVWRGLNPEGKYEEFIEKNPEKKVSIGWKLKEGILIAIL